jgi:hypothetical protein
MLKEIEQSEVIDNLQAARNEPGEITCLWRCIQNASKKGTAGSTDGPFFHCIYIYIYHVCVWGGGGLSIGNKYTNERERIGEHKLWFNNKIFNVYVYNGLCVCAMQA